MKFIHYSSTTVLTSDIAADAVVEYAAVLAHDGEAEVIDVPAVDDDGVAIIERMLLGPASLIVVEPAPDDVLEPDDRDFARALAERARGPRRGPPDPPRTGL
jgi:hypothetical protein